MPHAIGTEPATTTLCRRAVSDGPHEPLKSRGSLLIAVKVVAVRARQHPKVVLSSDLLYVYDAVRLARKGSAASPSRIAARSRPSPTFSNSRTRPSADDASAFAFSVLPCASIVVGATKTARFSSLLSVKAGAARRFRSMYM